MATKSNYRALLFPEGDLMDRKQLGTTIIGIGIELVTSNLAVLVLYLVIPEIRSRFLEMNIHPLVVVTAALGIRHGYLAGLGAALAASLVYIAAYLIGGLSLPLFFGSFIYYKYVIMFFVTGYTMGRIRDTYSRNIRTMRITNRELLDEYSELEKQHETTQAVNRELKEQIVGSEYSIFSLYEIAASLQTTNPEKVYTEAIGLLHKFIKATTISIYTLESGGYLRMKIIFGDYTRKKSSIRFVDEPRYLTLVESRKPVRWSRNGDEDFPLFSAPIIDEETVIGIINIDNIEFEHTTEYSFSVFCVISEWISKALSHAIAIDRKYNVTGVSWSNLLKKHQFDNQLQEEEIRLEKYGLPYCYGKFRVLSPDPQDVVFRMRKVLRSVDFVTYDEEENAIEILLPATSSGNYQKVQDRIEASLSGYVEELE